MSTYTDHQQRELDAASGAEMDRRAAAQRPVDAAPMLRLLRRADLFAEALELLQQALAAEYARGRVDGAREVGDRLVQPRGAVPSQGPDVP